MSRLLKPPTSSVPKQTWNQSISAKKSPSHLLDLGKIKPLYVGQFKQPLVLAKLKSRLKWASRNSIIRCPIWPLVLAQHWANTGAWKSDFTPLQGLLFVQCSMEKNNKTCCNFFYLLRNWILNFTRVRVSVLIFLSLSCSLVSWYEPNKKFWDILLCFPIPDCGKRKPTCRSWVWWLAKLA